MKKILALLVVLLFLSNNAFAAYSSPLEGLLVRAKFAFIAKVISYEDGKVTLVVTEKLRGESEKEQFVFDFKGGEKPAKDDLFFVFSQGHDQFGEPKDIIQIGQPFKAQAGYCGWIMLPIKKENEVEIVEHIHSIKFKKSGEEKYTLTLEQAKTLVKEGKFEGGVKEKSSEKEYLLSDDLPMGQFGFRLGKFLIIEGISVDIFNTFIVDTVNGEKLDKSILTWVEGKSPLPKGKRCVIRGYESGRMIGVPDEVVVKEGIPQPAAGWQFHRYFVVTSLKEGEDPAFFEPRGSINTSGYGSATISVKKTELFTGENFSVQITIANNQGTRDYFNPLLKPDIPIPAKLVLFSNDKKFIRNLYWDYGIQKKEIKKEDWQKIERKAHLDGEIGQFHLTEPGEYYLQLIYSHTLISKPYNPYSPYNPYMSSMSGLSGTGPIGPTNPNKEKTKEIEEKISLELNKEELFRSNAVKIKVNKKVVE